MSKTDMLSIYQGMEYKLAEQQADFFAKNGKVDYGLMIKLEVIQNKIAELMVDEYEAQEQKNKDFLSDSLGKYGITI